MKIWKYSLVFVVLALVAGQGLAGRVLALAAPFQEGQVCYAVADSGGGPPGDDLLVMLNIDTGEETVIGSPGTINIEAIAFDLGEHFMYASNAGQLGILDLETAAFNPLPQPYGIGRGERGNVLINDVDGLSFQWETGILFGVHRSDEYSPINDLLVQIDTETGALVQDAFGVGVDYLIIRAGEVTTRWHIDDIAFDPITNEMYATNNYQGRNDLLVVIDPTTGAIDRVIGSMDVEAGLGLQDMEGLSFDAFGVLIGTTGRDGAPYANRLFWIDKVTGQAELNTALPFQAGGDYEAVDCLATPPTAVELIYFQAEKAPADSIMLRWATGAELDLFGFRIYRGSTPDFSPDLLVHFQPAESSGQGQEYSFLDTPPSSPSGEWYYWLADVDGKNKETLHGPVLIAAPANLFKVFLPFGLNAQP